jgi:hypothetical protein
MRHFTYFIETARRGADEALMKAAGLAYALSENAGVSYVLTSGGPGGVAGVLVVPNGPAGESVVPAYKPVAQTWRKLPPAAGTIDGKPAAVWVGVDNAEKPGPDDLARKRMRDGQSVKLLDGNEWIVPRCVAMLEGRNHTLPQVLDIGDDGTTVVGKLDPRYTSLCDHAFDFWRMWAGYEMPEAERLTAQQEIALAADGLAVNYRVSKVEIIALLGLWGTDEYGLILRAMIDADEVEAYWKAEAEKKSTLAAPGSGTNSGEPAVAPTTNSGSPT